MANVTAVILSKNEQDNIVDCIESVRWCNEIMVIDDYSEDNTVELAKQQKARVYSHRLNNDFAAQRNYGLEKATGEWVLFLDADERVSLSLQYELLSLINNPLSRYKGYYLKRKDFMWGRELKYGEVGNIKLLRLARKESGEWKGKVHEVWHIDGETVECNNSLLHYPHPTLRIFLQEINFYSSLRAQELFKQKRKSHILDIILYPKAKFFLNFIVRKGFLDGLQGLFFATLMSFHSFLVRAKLWQLWNSRHSR